MEANNTIDGSGSKILEGASDGALIGTISGVAAGGIDGVFAYAKNPSGFCFLAGTLVLTSVGLEAIENVEAGDLVYAVEAEGVEQTVTLSEAPELKAVLETYVREVDETYVVTIDGEEIETTGEHPFYSEDGELVKLVRQCQSNSIC